MWLSYDSNRTNSGQLNDSMSNSQEHAMTDLEKFSHWFQGFYGYASLVVCVFGIITNFANISILLRKNMRTPINILLMWMAVFDILTIALYMPVLAKFYCPPMEGHLKPVRFTYWWIVCMVIVINFAATTHTISIWIAVALAVIWRFTTLGPVANERRIRQVKIAMLTICVSSPLVLIPNYMTNKMVLVSQDNNVSFWMLEEIKLASNETVGLHLINALTYATVAKIFPCCLILGLGCSFGYSLTMKGRSRQRRLATSSCSQNSKRAQQVTMTRMLLVIIILFLVTELPHGVLILLTAILPGFYGSVYMSLMDLIDFIALVNNSINFVLYCTMNKQFRASFAEMYLRRRRPLKAVTTETMTPSEGEWLTLRELPTRTNGTELCRAGESAEELSSTCTPSILPSHSDQQLIVTPYV